MFSIIFLVSAIKLPTGTEVSTVIGPRFWPLYLLIFLLVLSLIQFITLFFGKQNNKESGNEDIHETVEVEKEEESPEDSGFIGKYRHWILYGLIVFYTFLMNVTGFIIATFLFVLCCTILLGLKKKLYVIATSISTTLLIFVLFDFVLNIPLP
jgi:putative tricarboxylic transport membrane protein